MYPARSVSVEHFCEIHSRLPRIKTIVSELLFNSDEM